MGQEVLYLLLVTSLIGNFVLATLAMRSSKQTNVLNAVHPLSELVKENKQLRQEQSQLQTQIKTLQDTIEQFKTYQAKLTSRNQELELAAKRIDLERSQTTSSQQQAQERTKQLEADRAQLNSRTKELEALLRQTQAQRQLPQDQPQIITLREADGYSFDAGSADVSPQFLAKLAQEVVPKLTALSERYDAQIVEVIGHTDGTSIRDTLRVKANLDDSLGQYLDPANTTPVFPFDNVGLGISRAVSVARALRASGLPTKLDIQPLSAAYLISPNNRTDPAPRRISDPSRRRIEIRIRRIGAN